MPACLLCAGLPINPAIFLPPTSCFSLVTFTSKGFIFCWISRSFEALLSFSLSSRTDRFRFFPCWGCWDRPALLRAVLSCDSWEPFAIFCAKDPEMKQGLCCKVTSLLAHKSRQNLQWALSPRVEMIRVRDLIGVFPVDGFLDSRKCIFWSRRSKDWNVKIEIWRLYYNVIQTNHYRR